MSSPETTTTTTSEPTSGVHRVAKVIPLVQPSAPPNSYRVAKKLVGEARLAWHTATQSPLDEAKVRAARVAIDAAWRQVNSVDVSRFESPAYVTSQIAAYASELHGKLLECDRLEQEFAPLAPVVRLADVRAKLGIAVAPAEGIKLSPRAHVTLLAVAVEAAEGFQAANARGLRTYGVQTAHLESIGLIVKTPRTCEHFYEPTPLGLRVLASLGPLTPRKPRTKRGEVMK